MRIFVEDWQPLTNGYKAFEGQASFPSSTLRSHFSPPRKIRRRTELQNCRQHLVCSLGPP